MRCTLPAGDRRYDAMTLRTKQQRAWRRTWPRRLCRLFVAAVATGMRDAPNLSLWTEGGSGSYGFSSMLVYISRKETELSFKIMDISMTGQSMGVQPEGSLWNTLTRHFLSLMEKPHPLQTSNSISEWYAENQTGRFVLYRTYSDCHEGMGQMMALESC